jgi:16S rRNA (cytosine967-C5)-methyltransferase
MTRRRVLPIGPPVVRGGRGRRLTPRRTPEDNVRVAAAWVLERTLETHAPVGPFLDSAMAPFDERDQGLLRELVMGTLRWLRRIDDVIARASHRSFTEIEPPLRAPLRIAAYQILFLDRVPAHAAVHEAVEQAHSHTHRGGASFVNAVLRRIAREPRLAAWPVEESDPVRRLAVEMSHPDFLVARWLERLGRPRALAQLAADNQPKPMQLLAFRDRGGRELLAEALIDEGLDVEPAALSPLGLTVRRGNALATAAFARGDFYVQDEASQVAALIPPPRPGERVLDAAAAPGGKSFALLAWEASVRPVLADVALPRVSRLAANFKRLGRPLPLLAADATRPALAAVFDRVILDLPCTGTGTLRRHPELKWRISEAEVGRLAEQAVGLLAGGAPLVVPGGLLIAITCSLEPEENEQVTARFLRDHADFSPLPLEGKLPAPAEPWIVAPGLWRLPTAGDHDGFSVSVLKRAERRR